MSTHAQTLTVATRAVVERDTPCPQIDIVAKVKSVRTSHHYDNKMS